jgi:Bacterial PH domain
MSTIEDPSLGKYLEPGERILWAGRPRGGLRLRRQDIFLIPFSLIWGGFAIFWEIGVLHTTANRHNPMAIVFPLFGIPFVCVGLYVIFGRFLVDARGRARTYYAVTSDRILIVSGIFSQQVKSLQLRTLTDVSFTQSSDGSGTITFGTTGFGNLMSIPGGSWPGARSLVPSFDMIDGVQEAYAVIRGAQKAAP